MFLADLHRHLDGSLRPATVEELARSLGLAVPPDLPFFPGMGLRAALARFEFTLRLLASEAAVRRVAAEMCEDAAAGGVDVLEIRFAPQLHAGAPPEAIVDAALDGIAGRAGLILCGLYGEPPSVLERLVAIAEDRPGVVGIDLAGGPGPADDFRLADYAAPFRRAAAIGLGRTVHAGEGRAAVEIRVAIEQLGANRIGHGVTLLDDPSIVEFVVERGTVIEACLTSNWQVGAIPSIEAHPLPRWLALGVRACVCTDNTLLSRTDSVEEHRRARAIPGMTDALLAQAVRNGREGAFRRCRR